MALPRRFGGLPGAPWVALTLAKARGYTCYEGVEAQGGSPYMLEMAIDSIRVSLMNYQRVVILKQKDGDRYLPI